MTDLEIMQYIAANPQLGRTKVASNLGISESRARELMRAVRCAADGKGIDLDPKAALQSELEKLGIDSDMLPKLRELFTVRDFPEVKLNIGKTRRFRVGIISDTHLSDKSCAMAELHDFYSRCKDADVCAVLHAGDLVAGHNVYKGQLVDLAHIGYMAQLRNVLQNYPVAGNGVKTYLIAGNHDLSFKQADGSEIVLDACDQRDDLIYCGAYDGRVNINGVSIGLHHGAGGATYAASYKIQRYIERIGAGQKPQIYVLGHYHSSFYMFTRNVHCWQPACFQKPNDFSVRLGLENTIGGWIVEIEADEDYSIRSLDMKFIPYYE